MNPASPTLCLAHTGSWQGSEQSKMLEHNLNSGGSEAGSLAACMATFQLWPPVRFHAIPYS